MLDLRLEVIKELLTYKVLEVFLQLSFLGIGNVEQKTRNDLNWNSLPINFFSNSGSYNSPFIFNLFLLLWQFRNL